MFYSNKAGPPSPAEPLYSVHVTERKRWMKEYDRHQNAVTNMKGCVDQTKPKCHDYRVIRALENTRRFVDSQKKAFIARENSKLADRIHQINTGERYKSLSGSKAIKQQSSPSLSHSHSVDTLHSTLRRRVAEDVRRDNASMVKRLLQVKTSPDVRRVFQEKDYLLHQKYKVLLTKIHPIPLPSPRKQKRKLPPVEQIPTVKADAHAASWPIDDCFLLQDDSGEKDKKKRKSKEKQRSRSHDSARSVPSKPNSATPSTPHTMNVKSPTDSATCTPWLNEVMKDVVRNVLLTSVENINNMEREKAKDEENATNP